MNEDLEYNSGGSSVLDKDDTTHNPDNGNFSIIKKRLLTVQEKIKEVESVYSLDRNEKHLTLQQQLDIVVHKLAFLKEEELDLTERVKELGND